MHYARSAGWQTLQCLLRTMFYHQISLRLPTPLYRSGLIRSPFLDEGWFRFLPKPSPAVLPRVASTTASLSPKLRITPIMATAACRDDMTRVCASGVAAG